MFCSLSRGDYCQDASGFLTCNEKSYAVIQQLVSHAIFFKDRANFVTVSHEGFRWYDKLSRRGWLIVKLGYTCKAFSILTKQQLPNKTTIAKIICQKGKIKFFQQQFLERKRVLEAAHLIRVRIGVREGIVLGGRKKFALKLTICPKNRQLALKLTF